MEIKVFTRSRNLELYERMMEFIPDGIECTRVTDFQEWHEADDYLLFVLSHAKDNVWCINLDEDCFILSWDHILHAINYMQRCGFTHAGVGEYSIDHRKHNWPWVMNPFFNIFAPVWAGRLDAEWAMRAVEPYNWLFAYMNTMGEPYYFDANTILDGITTSVSFANIPLAVHTWYSRMYPEDPVHTNRINTVYKYVKNG